MATATDIISVAQKEIGTKESPAGSNRVKYNTWYYGKPVSGNAYPWCMVFCQWVFSQAGAPLPARTASCGELMRAAIQNRCFVTKDFLPGDVVIYNFPGGGETDHCGIVESVSPNGIVAIEGNTSEKGSQSNGGMVCRKTRQNKYIVGAVRPKIKREETMTDKEIYEAVQRYAATLSVPSIMKSELQNAIDMGITDGKNPMQLVPRYQAAIMAARAVKGAKE